MHRNARQSIHYISQCHGFQTDVRDLTYRSIIPLNHNIIASDATFLNPDIPPPLGKWRATHAGTDATWAIGTFAGIAACFREDLAVQIISADIRYQMEIIFFKIHGETRTQACVCYRPQWRGWEPLAVLQSRLSIKSLILVIVFISVIQSRILNAKTLNMEKDLSVPFSHSKF